MLFSGERLGSSIKPDRIAEPEIPSDLGRDVLDERDVVEVKLVGQVNAAGGKNVGITLARDHV